MTYNHEDTVVNSAYANYNGTTVTDHTTYVPPITNLPQAQKPCPSCGHCPTCGRSNPPTPPPNQWTFPPYVQPWNQYFPYTITGAVPSIGLNTYATDTTAAAGGIPVQFS